MAQLTTKKRNSLSGAVFALPKQRKYPMPDRAHQINAKARATQMEKAGKLSPSNAEKIKAKADRLLSHGR
jgi:hypothetical protein